MSGNSEDGCLSIEAIKEKLSTLGKHPLVNRHCFLELKITDLHVKDISALASYPLLIYVDLSNNLIEDITPLESLGCLTQLRASRNKLKTCLQYYPPKCSQNNRWSSGKHAIGSMLTLADLSYNLIDKIDSLDHHPFLEALILSHNTISSISGLQSLRFLKTLDLSYNKLTKIQGLDNLPIQELSLEGNELMEITGLDRLPHLSVLNVSRNKISGLEPLSQQTQLTMLNVGYNEITRIKEVKALDALPWLNKIILEGNPCCEKIHFRLRVFYMLPNLQILNSTIITAEDKIRACNLYQSEGGDWDLQKATRAAYSSIADIVPFRETFVDDEE